MLEPSSWVLAIDLMAMKHRSRLIALHPASAIALAFVLLVLPPAGATSQEAPDIGPLRNAPFVRVTGDVLRYELVPSYKGTFKGTSFSTNRWGMRDKDYAQKPPPRTYRMALVGSSYTMGGGVADDQTIDWLLEERLNAERRRPSDLRYEILNYSVGGYGILQNVAVTEKKVLPFSPNAVLLVLQSSERRRMVSFLSGLVRAGVPVEYPFVREKLQQAGVTREMEEPELRRRLSPFAVDLVRWSFQRIVEKCRQRGMVVVGILFPETGRNRERELKATAGWASEAGIPVLTLDGTYTGHPISSVKLSATDFHLNALGHRLVADRLYQALRSPEAEPLKLGFAVPGSGH